MSNALMAKMNLKGKRNKFAFGDTTLCRIIVGKFNNAWYNTMKIWKEVFHSFTKETVLHLSQISEGLGS
jgi:hypothetical protein